MAFRLLRDADGSGRWVRRLIVVILAGCLLTPLAAAQEAPRVKLTRIIERSERLERPVYLTNDGTDRLFIVEQPGRVRLYVDGVLEKQPYLNIERKVASQGECGLLSIAFHPQFAKNGRLFVNYTTRSPRLMTVISEFTVTPSATRVDPSTERVILTIDQPYANHNGGHVLFGLDGMLYIGMGDGGAAGDPQNHGQNMQSLLGKILRIDIDGKRPYAVPKDNPFVKDRRYRPEIFASGLRNPWRICIDPETGTIYTGDVGQNAFEEIDVIVAGGNYGWKYFEGTHDYARQRDEPECIPPIKEYPRNLGVSVTGGYVYRGSKYPAWHGWYFYADYASGRLWGLKYEDGKVTADAELTRVHGQPASFGLDKDGEMYICDHGGAIYRIDAEETR